MPFVGLDDDVTSKFGKLVSVETFAGIAANLAYVMDSMPLGSKVPILIGLAGVPTPDPSIWLPCEGEVVVDVTSPLRDQTLPDDRGLYPKGATTIGATGLTGGSNSNSYAHNHTGVTSVYDIGADNADDASQQITVNQTHAHGMFSDLVGPYNMEPRHIRVRFYIKVK